MRKNCIFGQGLSQEGRAVEYYINRLHALLSHKHILRWFGYFLLVVESDALQYFIIIYISRSIAWPKL